MPFDLTGLLLGLAGFALPTALALATRAGERPGRWAWGAVAGTALAWAALALHVRGLPTDGPALAARLQWLLVGVALAALAALGLRARVQASRRGAEVPDRTDRALLAIAALGLVLRAAYPHAVLHAELFGPRLLSIYFDFPAVTSFRESYGQVAFFVLGALSHLGSGIGTITLTNGVFSALTVLVAGRLVRRWTGKPVAALTTATLLAIQPVFLRVGTSEDAHVLGVLLFAGALLAFERALDEASDGGALATGTLLLCLVSWSRQSFVPLVFVPYLALVERHGWRALARPAVAASVLAVGGAALGQVLRNALHQHNQFVHYLLPALQQVPSHLLAEPHPLLDPTVSPLPVPLLLAAGALAGRRVSRVWLAPLAGLVMIGLLSAPMAVFGPGVQLTFRLPLLFLAALLAGLGAVVLWEALPGSRAARLGVTAAAAALLLAGSAAGAWRLARPDPQTQELDFLERVLPQLPPNATIVTPFCADLFGPDDSPVPRPTWNFPHFLLDPRNGNTFVSLGAYREEPPKGGGPVLFYRNLACHALTLSEGNADFDRAFRRVVLDGDRAALPSLLAAMFAVGTVENQPDPALVRKLRAPCYEGPAVGEALGPQFVTRVTKPDPAFTPNLYFPEASMEIGFYALPR